MALGSLPAADAPVYAYAKYFDSHHDLVLVTVSVATLGLALTVCFLAALWDFLRKTEGSGGALCTVAVASGLLRVGVLLAGAAFLLASAYRFGQGDPSAARSMTDLYGMASVLSALPTALSLAAFGLGMLRVTSARWIGWFTLLVGATQLVGCGTLAQSGPFAPTGYVGTLLLPSIYYGWVAVVSLTLFLRPAR